MQQKSNLNIFQSLAPGIIELNRHIKRKNKDDHSHRLLRVKLHKYNEVQGAILNNSDRGQTLRLSKPVHSGHVHS